MDENCIFCKLANGVFSTNVVYEDDDFTAFLDASPASEGHTLIVPKKHVANAFELPDDLGAKVYPVVKKVAARQKEGDTFVHAALWMHQRTQEPAARSHKAFRDEHHHR